MKNKFIYLIIIYDKIFSKFGIINYLISNKEEKEHIKLRNYSLKHSREFRKKYYKNEF